MIYMDNAATTLQKPPEVAEAVVKAMSSIGNAGRGANDASLDAARIIFLMGIIQGRLHLQATRRRA